MDAADLVPVEAHDQGPLAAPFEPTSDHAAQGGGDLDPFVGREPPGALDAVLGGGRSGKMTAPLGQTDTRRDQRGGDQDAEGLGWTEPEGDGDTEDPGDDIGPFPGGLSRSWSPGGCC